MTTPVIEDITSLIDGDEARCEIIPPEQPMCGAPATHRMAGQCTACDYRAEGNLCTPHHDMTIEGRGLCRCGGLIEVLWSRPI